MLLPGYPPGPVYKVAGKSRRILATLSKVPQACVSSNGESATAAGSGGASRRLRALMQTIDLVRCVHRPADHINGRPYLLLRPQPLPRRHCLAQGRTISLNIGSIVQPSQAMRHRHRFCRSIAVPLFLLRPGAGKRQGLPPRPALNFGRRDLEKGMAPATRVLFVTGVDPGLDCLPGVRCVKDVTLQRRMVSSLR